MSETTFKLQITAVVRWPFWPENTFDFVWSEGLGWRGGRPCFKPFLEDTYFLRLVMVIIRIIQPFILMFFLSLGFIYLFIYFSLVNFYLVTRFPVTRYSLLVTRYCVTLFRNTHPQPGESALQSGNFWIRYISGNSWTLNPDIFYPLSSQDRKALTIVKFNFSMNLF